MFGSGLMVSHTSGRVEEFSDVHRLASEGLKYSSGLLNVTDGNIGAKI